MPSPNPALRRINPPTLSPTTRYSHVVETRGAHTVYISGQVALDAQGKLVGPGDMRAQATQVFTNIKAALAAVGADYSHVAKLTIFVTNAARMQEVRDARDQFVDTSNPPASTAVEVSRLVGDDFLLEVDAIAVLPD